MLDTREHLLPTDFPTLERRGVDTLQVNLGYRCNQSCLHCHVAAGPNRTEQMATATLERLLEVIERRGITTLDLTGGAPELHPDFRWLVAEARARGCHVIDRCNLTILEEPDQRPPHQTDLAEFLAAHQVEIIASLPCYLAENVDNQRGKGVFDASLRGLRRLNDAGYGRDPARPLNLVYNPQGPDLPPPQGELEAAYRAHLENEYGLHFTRLLALTNMPIQRFGSQLLSRGQFHDYLTLLRDAYRAENRDALMCRTLVSVGWRGTLYDCDFNQMLHLNLGGEREPVTLDALLDASWTGAPIAVGEHCYGCTAGQGSSCGGALE